MKNRVLHLLIVLFLVSTTCFGQSSFQEITPGASTRNDVARVLGQPVRTISATLFEYTSPAGIAKVEVAYGASSSIVEQIEVYFLKPITRAALTQKFNLPQQPHARTTDAEGKLVEYFGDLSLIVLTYASVDVSGGVSRIGYYSRELFAKATASSQGARQNPGTQAGTSQSGAGPAALGEMNLPDYMRPPAGSTSVSADRSGRTSPSVRNSQGTGPGNTKGTTTTTRTHRPSDGGSPITVTTRSGDVFDVQPSTRSGATGDHDASSAETEINLSASKLRRLVGSYQFIQPAAAKPAEVELVTGKLRLTMGRVTYALTAIAGDNFVTGEEGELFSFKAADQPGVKVYFLMSDNKIEKLFIVENQRQPKRFSVAVPKP